MTTATTPSESSKIDTVLHTDVHTDVVHTDVPVELDSDAGSSAAKPAVPDFPILLDVPAVRAILDVLGALALFTTAAITLSTSDAYAVTAVVGAFVVAARVVRAVRSRRSPWKMH